jgi:Zn-dependent peptidase ImmA (M78 family)/transcriptional regulator with XRE-family HTH domain
MIGQRIRLAREVCAMTQTELAASVGISQGTLSSIEIGQILQPSKQVVRQIAAATGFPPTFFYLGPLPDFPEGSFRRLARGRSKVSAQVRAQVRHIAEVVQRTESNLTLPPTTLKPTSVELNVDQIERYTVEIRQFMGVGQNEPIPNLTRAVERAGVIVISIPTEMPDHDGFSIWPDYGLEGRPLVALTRGARGDRNRFTLAHELGHLLLHTLRPNVDAKTAEGEANRFAGSLLIPRRAALQVITTPVTLGVLMRVKATHGTSIAMTAKRALDLKIIDQRHFISLRKQLSARGWTKAEPVEVGAENPILISKILLAAGGEGSWSERAARLPMQTFSYRALASA